MNCIYWVTPIITACKVEGGTEQLWRKGVLRNVAVLQVRNVENPEPGFSYEEAVPDSVVLEGVIRIGLGENSLLFLLCALFY